MSVGKICGRCTSWLTLALQVQDQYEVSDLLDLVMQVYILDAIAKMQIKEAKDAESIVERVVPRLQHANSAVVLSAVKVRSAAHTLPGSPRHLMLEMPHIYMHGAGRSCRVKSLAGGNGRQDCLSSRFHLLVLVELVSSTKPKTAPLWMLLPPLLRVKSRHHSYLTRSCHPGAEACRTLRPCNASGGCLCCVPFFWPDEKRQCAEQEAMLCCAQVVLLQLPLIADEAAVKTLVKKLGPPLVTLLSEEAEVQYVALRNINLIVQKHPEVLSHEIKASQLDPLETFVMGKSIGSLPQDIAPCQSHRGNCLAKQRMASLCWCSLGPVQGFNAQAAYYGPVSAVYVFTRKGIALC